MCLNRSSDCSLQVSHDENSRMYFHLPARSLPAVYLHVRVRQRTSVFVQVIRFIRLTAPISVSGYRQFGQLNFDKLASDAKRGRAKGPEIQLGARALERFLALDLTAVSPPTLP